MNAKEYHQQFVQLVDGVAAITKSEIEFREIDENECYLKAVLSFARGYALHIAEYVLLEGQQITRDKYRYELLDPKSQHIVRWDNAPHFPELNSFPDHRHDAQELVHNSRPMSPRDAIAESLDLIEQYST